VAPGATGRTFSFRLGRGPAPRVEADGEGFAWVGPRVATDGGEPPLLARGSVEAADGALLLQGRTGSPAAWLSPARVTHAGVEALLRPAPEDEGGDDALLLHDAALDARGVLSARFAGLVDGGRKVAAGRLEGGRLQVETTAEAPSAPSDGDGTRAIHVGSRDGRTTVRVDGRVVLEFETKERPEEGAFGVLAHGGVEVVSTRAFDQFDVHRTRFASLPVVAVTAGDQELSIELPPGGPSIDSVRIQLSAP
jgi:hypothetical protein